MNAWWLLFSGGMIVSPLVFALGVRCSADPDADAPRARRLTLWLICASLASLGLMLALWQTAGVRVAMNTWPLFFPLFFFLAMPAMRAKNPAWRPAHEAQPVVRTAMVAPGDRARTSPVPRWVWALGWIAFAGAVIALALRPALAPMAPEDGEAWGGGGWTQWIIAVVVLMTTVPFLLLLTPRGVQAAMREPEPMDAQETAELAQAYEALRRTKAWFFAGLFLVMGIAICVTMPVLAWIDSAWAGATMGLVGGIGGSLIGIAGGVGGVALDLKRTKINTLLRQLEQDQREPA